MHVSRSHSGCKVRGPRCPAAAGRKGPTARSPTQQDRVLSRPAGRASTVQVWAGCCSRLCSPPLALWGGPSSESLGSWLPALPPLSMERYVSVPLGGHPCLDQGPPAPARPPLNLIISAKTLFPDTATVTGMGLRTWTYHFGGHDSTHHGPHMRFPRSGQDCGVGKIWKDTPGRGDSTQEGVGGCGGAGARGQVAHSGRGLRPCWLVSLNRTPAS